MENYIHNARVFIVVKAYPNPSRKHRETVCTAGILETGEWIRIYPVSYRFLADEKKYPKYSWITVNLERRLKDVRPESYGLRQQTDFFVEPSLPVSPNVWKHRKRIVLQNTYPTVSSLIKASNKPRYTSLGVVKPACIHKVVVTAVDREWDHAAIEAIIQPDLFGEQVKKEDIVRKVPYQFSYHFTCIDGAHHTLMIEDWEIGALYWNCLRSSQGDETRAIEKVEAKLMKLANESDLYLILGTTLQFHTQNALNPFVIIGLFYPPIDHQLELF